MDLSGPMQGVIDKSKIQISENDPSIGPLDAKVQIIDFSDYYCPTCFPIYEESIKPILEEFAGRIRFVSRQVIAIAQESYTAIHAALCAHDQGKYWEMHDLIMGRIEPFVTMPHNIETYEKLMDLVDEGTIDFFVELAKNVDGIDIDRFAKCMKSECHKEYIHNVSEEFKSLNLRGVPVTVVNNIYCMGYVSTADLRKMIQRELDQADGR